MLAPRLRKAVMRPQNKVQTAQQGACGQALQLGVGQP